LGRSLEKHGIAIYPRLVPEKLCLHLLSRMKEFTNGPDMNMDYEESYTGRSVKDRDWTEGTLLHSIQCQIFKACQLNVGQGSGKVRIVSLKYHVGFSALTLRSSNSSRKTTKRPS
jgi:hypothetical protein